MVIERKKKVFTAPQSESDEDSWSPRSSGSDTDEDITPSSDLNEDESEYDESSADGDQNNSVVVGRNDTDYSALVDPTTKQHRLYETEGFYVTKPVFIKARITSEPVGKDYLEYRENFIYESGTDNILGEFKEVPKPSRNPPRVVVFPLVTMGKVVTDNDIPDSMDAYVFQLLGSSVPIDKWLLRALCWFLPCGKDASAHFMLSRYDVSTGLRYRQAYQQFTVPGHPFADRESAGPVYPNDFVAGFNGSYEAAQVVFTAKGDLLLNTDGSDFKVYTLDASDITMYNTLYKNSVLSAISILLKWINVLDDALDTLPRSAFDGISAQFVSGDAGNLDWRRAVLVKCIVACLVVDTIPPGARLVDTVFFPLEEKENAFWNSVAVRAITQKRESSSNVPIYDFDGLVTNGLSPLYGTDALADEAIWIRVRDQRVVFRMAMVFLMHPVVNKLLVFDMDRKWLPSEEFGVVFAYRAYKGRDQIVKKKRPVIVTCHVVLTLWRFMINALIGMHTRKLPKLPEEMNEAFLRDNSIYPDAMPRVEFDNDWTASNCPTLRHCDPYGQLVYFSNFEPTVTHPDGLKMRTFSREQELRSAFAQSPEWTRSWDLVGIHTKSGWMRVTTGTLHLKCESSILNLGLVVPRLYHLWFALHATPSSRTYYTLGVFLMSSATDDLQFLKSALTAHATARTFLPQSVRTDDYADMKRTLSKLAGASCVPEDLMDDRGFGVVDHGVRNSVVQERLLFLSATRYRGLSSFVALVRMCLHAVMPPIQTTIDELLQVLIDKAKAKTTKRSGESSKETSVDTTLDTQKWLLELRNACPLETILPTFFKYTEVMVAVYFVPDLLLVWQHDVQTLKPSGIEVLACTQHWQSQYFVDVIRCGILQYCFGFGGMYLTYSSLLGASDAYEAVFPHELDILEIVRAFPAIRSCVDVTTKKFAVDVGKVLPAIWEKIGFKPAQSPINGVFSKPNPDDYNPTEMQMLYAHEKDLMFPVTHAMFNWSVIWYGDEYGEYVKRVGVHIVKQSMLFEAKRLLIVRQHTFPGKYALSNLTRGATKKAQLADVHRYKTKRNMIFEKFIESRKQAYVIIGGPGQNEEKLDQLTTLLHPEAFAHNSRYDIWLHLSHVVPWWPDFNLKMFTSADTLRASNTGIVDITKLCAVPFDINAAAYNFLTLFENGFNQKLPDLTRAIDEITSDKNIVLLPSDLKFEYIHKDGPRKRIMPLTRPQLAYLFVKHPWLRTYFDYDGLPYCTGTGLIRKRAMYRGVQRMLGRSTHKNSVRYFLESLIDVYETFVTAAERTRGSSDGYTKQQMKQLTAELQKVSDWKEDMEDTAQTPCRDAIDIALGLATVEKHEHVTILALLKILVDNIWLVDITKAVTGPELATLRTLITNNTSRQYATVLKSPFRHLVRITDALALTHLHLRTTLWLAQHLPPLSSEQDAYDGSAESILYASLAPKTAIPRRDESFVKMVHYFASQTSRWAKRGDILSRLDTCIRNLKADHHTLPVLTENNSIAFLQPYCAVLESMLTAKEKGTRWEDGNTFIKVHVAEATVEVSYLNLQKLETFKGPLREKLKNSSADTKAEWNRSCGFTIPGTALFTPFHAIAPKILEVENALAQAQSVLAGWTGFEFDAHFKLNTSYPYHTMQHYRVHMLYFLGMYHNKTNNGQSINAYFESLISSPPKDASPHVRTSYNRIVNSFHSVGALLRVNGIDTSAAAALRSEKRNNKKRKSVPDTVTRESMRITGAPKATTLPNMSGYTLSSIAFINLQKHDTQPHEWASSVQDAITVRRAYVKTWESADEMVGYNYEDINDFARDLVTQTMSCNTVLDALTTIAPQKIMRALSYLRGSTQAKILVSDDTQRAGMPLMGRPSGYPARPLNLFGIDSINHSPIGGWPKQYPEVADSGSANDNWWKIVLNMEDLSFPEDKLTSEKMGLFFLAPPNVVVRSNHRMYPPTLDTLIAGDAEHIKSVLEVCPSVDVAKPAFNATLTMWPRNWLNQWDPEFSYPPFFRTGGGEKPKPKERPSSVQVLPVTNPPLQLERSTSNHPHNPRMPSTLSRHLAANVERPVLCIPPAYHLARVSKYKAFDRETIYSNLKKQRANTLRLQTEQRRAMDIDTSIPNVIPPADDTTLLEASDNLSGPTFSSLPDDDDDVLLGNTSIVEMSGNTAAKDYRAESDALIVSLRELTSQDRIISTSSSTAARKTYVMFWPDRIPFETSLFKNPAVELSYNIATPMPFLPMVTPKRISGGPVECIRPYARCLLYQLFHDVEARLDLTTGNMSIWLVRYNGANVVATRIIDLPIPTSWKQTFMRGLGNTSDSLSYFRLDTYVAPGDDENNAFLRRNSGNVWHVVRQPVIGNDDAYPILGSTYGRTCGRLSDFNEFIKKLDWSNLMLTPNAMALESVSASTRAKDSWFLLGLSGQRLLAVDGDDEELVAMFATMRSYSHGVNRLVVKYNLKFMRTIIARCVSGVALRIMFASGYINMYPTAFDGFTYVHVQTSSNDSSPYLALISYLEQTDNIAYSACFVQQPTTGSLSTDALVWASGDPIVDLSDTNKINTNYGEWLKSKFDTWDLS